MRSTPRILAALTGGLLLAAPVAPALAGGGPPTRTPFEIVLEPTVDDILTAACGFTVYSAIHLTGMEFSFKEGQQSGLGYMETFRNDVTFSANGKSLTFIERAHNVARFRDDGTVTFTIAGREFGNSIIGRKVLTFDPETGELLDVAYVGQSLDLAGDFCAALAA
jgi:hypothetical protein